MLDTLTVPLLAPGAVGEKRISMAQAALCATTSVAAQFPFAPPTSTNSLLLAAMIPSVTLPGPLLVMVTRWIAEGWPTAVTPGNAIEFGDASTTGTGSALPVPASVTVSGLPATP